MVILLLYGWLFWFRFNQKMGHTVLLAVATLATALVFIRLYRITPDHLMVILSAALGVLLLSEWFCCFPLNEQKGYTILAALVTVAAALVFMLLWFIRAITLARRFQFSLRSLMVLVVVVSILCSWFSVKLRAARRQERAVATLWKYRGIVRYDYQSIPGASTPPPAPMWLMHLLGGDFFHDLHLVDLAADETFTDQTAACLEDVPQLDTFRLSRAALSDDGLVHVGNMRGLKHLTLQHMPITDAGLEHLKTLGGLKKLVFNNTQVTDEGLKKLRPALPKCKIVRYGPPLQTHDATRPIIDSINGLGENAADESRPAEIHSRQGTPP